MQRSRLDQNKFSIYLILALAVVLSLFSTVYRPDKGLKLKRDADRLKVVVDEDSTIKQRRVIVPIKLLVDKESKLKRTTKFISRKENRFAGKTSDNKIINWKKATKNRGLKSLDNLKKVVDSSKNSHTVKNSPLKKSVVIKTKLKTEDFLFSNLKISPIQDLPYFKDLKTDLLINFDIHGNVSLGTKAYKHSEYFFNMVSKISKRWHKYFPIVPHVYGLLKTGDVIVTYTLNLDGMVVSVKLTKSYGQESLDYACIEAVKVPEGFGPIPKEFREKGEMKIPFLFIYKRPPKPRKMFR